MGSSAGGALGVCVSVLAVEVADEENVRDGREEIDGVGLSGLSGLVGVATDAGIGLGTGFF